VAEVHTEQGHIVGPGKFSAAQNCSIAAENHHKLAPAGRVLRINGLDSRLTKAFGFRLQRTHLNTGSCKFLRDFACQLNCIGSTNVRD
jgi:hypothetical protein